MDDMIQAIVSAVIAYVVPVILKQFLPPAKVQDSLPVLPWCVAGFVGGALGGIASGMVALAGVGGVGGIGNWAAFGTCIGLFQWFALRGYRPVGGWFVLASALGWLIFPVGGAFGWMVSGAAVGLLQYLGLTNYKGSGWWIIGNVIAWPLAGVAGLAVMSAFSDPFLPWIMGGGAAALVGAVVLLFPLSRLKE